MVSYGMIAAHALPEVPREGGSVGHFCFASFNASVAAL